MKIRELIRKQSEVERTINILINKLPKPNEFRVDSLNPYAEPKTIRLSLDEVVEVVDSLTILNKLLDRTIESISVNELFNIDDCFKD